MELSLLFSALLGAALFWAIYSIRLGSFRQHALSLIQQAEAKVREKSLSQQLERQKQDEALRKEASELEAKQAQLKSRIHQISQESEKLKKDQTRLAAAHKEVEEQKKAALEALERNSGLTMDQAREMLLQRLKETLQSEAEHERRNWRKTFEIECTHRAQALLLSALERKTQGLTKESFLTHIPLSDQSIIPKIIGKDGRNIQTLEELLQVSLIIEEKPPRLLVSAHDPRQRLFAQWTIEKLISEERITPVIIRETWKACQANYARQIEEHGAKAAGTCLPSKALPPEMLSALGSLAFRSTCGQNVLAHSMEVSDLMGLLAAEMGLDVDRARAIGLFHDIGKGLSKEWGITHASAGKAFLEKWRFDKTIVNGVAAHHGEEPSQTIEARLLPICDRLSSQLPGARSVAEPAFLSLVRSCEEVAKKLPLVRSAWAHYGGTHIELIIRHEPIESTAPLLGSVQEALRAVNLPIPVHVTFTSLR